MVADKNVSGASKVDVKQECKSEVKKPLDPLTCLLEPNIIDNLMDDKDEDESVQGDKQGQYMENDQNENDNLESIFTSPTMKR